MTDTPEDSGTTIMKLVEAIAITPQDARAVVSQYEKQARRAHPSAPDEAIRKLVTSKVIQRYSKMAAASGGATSLAGVVPGLGTAVAMIGGGVADVSLCMKFQIDMTMCLAVAINEGITNEDAKHMSFVIALAGSLEKFGSEAGKATASKAAVRVASEYLTGATLQIIKQLFKKVGIIFTQKAAVKAIPFGVGVVIGSSANYFLTRYVGHAARDVFLIERKGASMA
jgi:hypothetical protein